jgi:hypothetical protein
MSIPGAGATGSSIHREYAAAPTSTPAAPASVNVRGTGKSLLHPTAHLSQAVAPESLQQAIQRATASSMRTIFKHKDTAAQLHTSDLKDKLLLYHQDSERLQQCSNATTAGAEAGKPRGLSSVSPKARSAASSNIGPKDAYIPSSSGSGGAATSAFADESVLRLEKSIAHYQHTRSQFYPLSPLGDQSSRPVKQAIVPLSDLSMLQEKLGTWRSRYASSSSSSSCFSTSASCEKPSI